MKIFCFALKKTRLGDNLLENEILKQSISMIWRCSAFKLPVGGTVPVYNQKEFTVQLQKAANSLGCESSCLSYAVS